MHLSVIGCSFHLVFLQFMDSAEWKQPQRHTWELLVDHIPAAWCVIPPFALSLKYQDPGRERQKKNQPRLKIKSLNYDTAAQWNRCRSIRTTDTLNRINNPQLIALCCSVDAVRQGGTHCLHPACAPCCRLADNSAVRGFACEGWLWQAACNPGELYAITDSHLQRSPSWQHSLKPGDSLPAAPPAIHDGPQHCQGHNNEASMKQQIGWRGTYFWASCSGGRGNHNGDNCVKCWKMISLFLHFRLSWWDIYSIYDSFNLKTNEHTKSGMRFISHSHGYRGSLWNKQQQN